MTGNLSSVECSEGEGERETRRDESMSMSGDVLLSLPRSVVTLSAAEDASGCRVQHQYLLQFQLQLQLMVACGTGDDVAADVDATSDTLARNCRVMQAD